MRIKKQLWNLHFGNKGYVFLLDVVIAVIVVAILLTSSYYYIGRSEENSLPRLQLVRAGSDIITLLDNENLLGPAKYKLEGEELKQIIRDKINNILPSNYDINITINSCEIKKIEECEIYSIGGTIPNDRFVATGKRYFTTIRDHKKFYYGTIKYWIWLK